MCGSLCVTFRRPCLDLSVVARTAHEHIAMPTMHLLVAAAALPLCSGLNLPSARPVLRAASMSSRSMTGAIAMGFEVCMQAA